MNQEDCFNEKKLNLKIPSNYKSKNRTTSFFNFLSFGTENNTGLKKRYSNLREEYNKTMNDLKNHECYRSHNLQKA